MGRIRSVIAFTLAAAGIAAGVVASGAPASADDLDPHGLQAACTYTYTVHGISNGFLIAQHGIYRAFADHRVQLATSPTCAERVRAAVNFRCERFLDDAVGWVAANCGSVGTVQLHQEPGGTTWYTPYEFGSTGTDGTTTVYGGFHDARACTHYYFSGLYVDRLTVLGNTWTVGGLRGNSHDFSYCPV